MTKVYIISSISLLMSFQTPYSKQQFWTIFLRVIFQHSLTGYSSLTTHRAAWAVLPPLGNAVGVETVRTRQRSKPSGMSLVVQ